MFLACSTGWKLSKLLIIVLLILTCTIYFLSEEEVPEKLQRENSVTTDLRKAINEAKTSASKEKKAGNYKADYMLLAEFPKVIFHILLCIYSIYYSIQGEIKKC